MGAARDWSPRRGSGEDLFEGSNADQQMEGQPLLDAKSAELGVKAGAFARSGRGGFAAWVNERATASGASRVALAIAVSLSWMTISSGLILVNKTILKDLNFP